MPALSSGASKTGEDRYFTCVTARRRTPVTLSIRLFRCCRVRVLWRWILPLTPEKLQDDVEGFLRELLRGHVSAILHDFELRARKGREEPLSNIQGAFSSAGK